MSVLEGFLQACANGDLEELQEILTAAQSYYNLDLNCKDQNGKSALVIALETENWACLELLLDNGVKIRDRRTKNEFNRQLNRNRIRSTTDLEKTKIERSLYP